VILYVPTAARLAPDHQLVRLLGWHQAVKLCQHFGGEILHPANCADVYRQFRDRSIVRMVRADGMDPALVAEMMDVSRRHVSNLLRENPQQERDAANDNDRNLIITEKLRAKF
jgi:CRP-like cAMP-binding protein